jgi:hypothetical protein
VDEAHEKVRVRIAHICNVFTRMGNGVVRLVDALVRALQGQGTWSRGAGFDEDPWEQLEHMVDDVVTAPSLLDHIMACRAVNYYSLSVAIKVGATDTTLTERLQSHGLRYRRITVGDIVAVNLQRTYGPGGRLVSRSRVRVLGMEYDLGAIFHLREGPVMYRLFSVWFHTGATAKGGHWRSAQLQGGLWYLCNDITISEPEPQEAFMQRLVAEASAIAGVWLIRSSLLGQIGR